MIAMAITLVMTMADLMLAVRGASTQEVQLLRGTPDGAFEQAVGWTPWSAPLQNGEIHTTDEAFPAGSTLFDSLPPTVRTELVKADAQKVVTRMIVAIDATTKPARRLLWSALHGEGFMAIVQNRWALLHWNTLNPVAPSPRVPITDKLRVLLLLTSLEGDGRQRARAVQLARDLRADTSTDLVDLVIAASTKEATNCDGEWLLIDQDTSVKVDEAYGDRKALQKLLTHGTLADLADIETNGSERPIHLLIVFGHSGQVGDRGLAFRFAKEDADHVVAPTTFGPWLAQRDLRIVLALSCRSFDLGEILLEVADHVVATHSDVDARDMARFARDLLPHLCSNVTLGAAILEGQSVLQERCWQIVHLARTLDHTPFMPSTECAMRAYHRRALHLDPFYMAFRDGGRASLLRVHVPLRIAEQREGAQPEDPPGVSGARGGAGEGEIEEADDASLTAPHRTITFEQVLRERGRRWLIRGDAGAGKTSTLRHAVLSQKADQFSVYIHLIDWLERHKPESAELDHVLGSLARLTSVSRLPDAMHAAAQRDSLVLLLDGFDELTNVSSRRFARDLLDTFSDWNGVRLVVAARRSIEPRTLGAQDWLVADLQPLDVAQQKELLLRWFKARGNADAEVDADRWAATFRRGSERLREIAGNPFLLTCLALLVLDRATDFERRRHEMLGDMLVCVLKGQFRADQTRPRRLSDTDRIRALLGRVAWEMLQVPTRSATRADVKEWVAAYPEVDVLKGMCDGDLDDLLAVLGEECGVFRPQGPVGTP